MSISNQSSTSSTSPAASTPAQPETAANTSVKQEMARRDMEFVHSQLTPATPGMTMKKRKRVLLVEGEWLARLILQDKLQAAGLEVEVALNGCLAQQKLRNPPDAILMELAVGGIQGLELINEAHKDKRNASLPIYVFTSQKFKTPAALKEASAGATKVFHKLKMPAEKVVSELAAELLGADAGNNRGAGSANQAELAALNEIPSILQESVAEIGRDLRVLALKTSDAEACLIKWRNLRDPVASLVSCASVAGRHDLARQSDALNDFLNVISEQPGALTDSSLQTASSTAYVLEALAGQLGAEPEPRVTEFTAVLVEASPEERAKAVGKLLEAGVKTTAFASADEALAHLGAHGADLVIFTVSGRDAGAFDAGKALRAVPSHQKTPIIFVIGDTDASRPLPPATLGPVDHLLKPYLNETLALKALNQIQKNRLPAPQPFAPMAAASAPAPAPVPAAPAVVASAPPASASAKTETDTRELKRMLEEALARELSPKPGVGGVPAPLSAAAKVATAATVVNKELEDRLTALQREMETKLAEARKEGESKLAALKREQETALDLLKKEREELQSRFTAEQTVSYENKRKADEFERKCREQAGELERAKNEAKQKGEEAQRAEDRWREELARAKAAADLAEVGLKGSTEKAEQSAKEASALRKERDELQGKYAAGEQALGKLKARTEELENRLRERGAELERARTELKKQGEAVLFERQEQRTQFQKELEAVRREREELKAKFASEQQSLAEAKQRLEGLEGRLRENAGELERTKAELKKQAEERQRLENQLHQELTTVRAANEKTEAGLKEKVAQSNQLGQELANLKKQRDELQAKFTAEQNASADSRRRAQELESRLHANLGELERARTLAQEKSKQGAQFEKELSELKQQRDELRSRLRTEERSLAEATQRAGELEERLRKNSGELEHLNGALAKQAAEQGVLSARLQEEMSATHEAVEKAEATLQDKAAQIKFFEQELSNLREERHKLHASFITEQRERNRLAQLVKELEERVASGGDSAAELRKLAESARADVKQAEAARKELQARVRSLESELNGLRKQAEESAKAKQAGGDPETAVVARLKSDVERERADRRRIEVRAISLAAQLQELHQQLGQNLELEQNLQKRNADLENQLQERESAIAQLHAAVEREAAIRREAEAEQKKLVNTFLEHARVLQTRFTEGDKTEAKTGVVAARKSAPAPAKRKVAKKPAVEKPGGEKSAGGPSATHSPLNE